MRFRQAARPLVAAAAEEAPVDTITVHLSFIPRLRFSRCSTASTGAASFSHASFGSSCCGCRGSRHSSQPAGAVAAAEITLASAQ